MLRLEDVGAFAYGGIVTGASILDDRRIKDLTITEKEVFKKMETWAYLGPGVAALLASGMGWLPRQAVWVDKIATGFIYDAPRFMKNVWESQKTTTPGGAQSRAVYEARQRIPQPAAQITSGKSTQRYPAEQLTKEFKGVRLVG